MKRAAENRRRSLREIDQALALIELAKQQLNREKVKGKKDFTLGIS